MLYPNTWFKCAVAAMHTADYLFSITCFTTLLKQNPEFGEGWSNLASVLMKVGKFKEAYEASCQSIRFLRENWHVWDNYVTISVGVSSFSHRQMYSKRYASVIEGLNELGGKNGIGILDIVENRLVGMKDRGVYETPGGTILYFAHEQLEMITVDKDTLHAKQKLAVDFADLIYNGKWFSPLREALSAFADKANEYVTGTVKLKLYKGNIIPAGMTSPYSLYSEDIATFNDSAFDYDQKDSAGFINLWGLPDTVQALREKGLLNK